MSKHVNKPHKCPVCGKYEFPDTGSFDVCVECGWEDDPVQEKYPYEDGGANELCLNDYRTKYNEGWRPDWIKGIKGDDDGE